MGSGWHGCFVSALGSRVSVVDLPNGVPCPAGLIDGGPDSGQAPITSDTGGLPLPSFGLPTTQQAQPNSSGQNSILGVNVLPQSGVNALNWFSDANHWKGIGLLAAAVVLGIVGVILWTGRGEQTIKVSTTTGMRST